MKVVPLERQHVEQASRLLSTSFDEEYSWSRPWGHPSERFENWLRDLYFPEILAPDYKPRSLVAICDDAMCGACTLTDFLDDEPPPDPGEEVWCLSYSVTCPCLTLLAIATIVAACKELFWSRGFGPKVAARGRIGYVAFVATDPGHRRRGVGDALLAQVPTPP